MITSPIRWRVFAVFTIGAAILGATVAFGLYLHYDGRLQETARTKCRRTEDLFCAMLDQDAEMMSGLVNLLEIDEKLQAAFRARDREALLSAATPIFQEVCSKNEVTHFYFHDIDRVCFLRVHNPPRYGDTINRFTMIEARQTGHPSAGIELGPLGTLTLRTVHPWEVHGKTIGYIELGKEINHVIPQVASLLNVDLCLLIDKAQLDKSNWEEGLGIIRGKGNWDLFTDFVLSDGTADEIPAELNRQLHRHQAAISNQIYRSDANGAHQRSGILPLIDASGHKVGEGIVIVDVTEDAHSLRSALLKLAGAVAAVFVLLSILFWLHLGRMERSLQTAHEVIQTAHSELDQIFNAAPPMAVFRLDQTILRVNDRCAELVGLDKDEFVGKNCCTLLAGSACGTESCCIAKVQAGHTSGGEQIKYLGKGRQLPCIVVAQPLRNGSNEIVGCVQSITDISELRETEQALRKSEQKHRTLYESSRDAVMTLAPPSWNFTSGNPATIELFQARDEQDFTMLSPADVSPESQPDGSPSAGKALEMIEIAVRDGSHFFEWIHKRADGTTFPATVLLTRMELAADMVLQATVRDNTLQKIADENRSLDIQRMDALLALNQMLDKSMEEITAFAVEESIRLTGSSIGYLAVLDEDEATLTMQYWSKSAHASCNMIDKPIIYPVQETGLWGEAVRQRRPVVTNDYSAPNPHKRGTPEGHVPVTRHMNIPVFDRGRIVAVAGVGNKTTDYDDRDVHQLQLFMDGWRHIAHRKTSMVELAEAYQAAEAATRAKSDFLANMSHEIRTPMTSILGYTDLLLDTLDDPEEIELANTVLRNGRNLLQLINDILDISKIEAGKMETDRISCCPRQVVSEVVALLRMRAENKGLTLTEIYEGAIPETITTDPARLRQILVNLLGNAIKFTESGGAEIVIQSSQDLCDQPVLTFDIVDTGIGIPASKIEDMFQPFTQADGSASRVYEGTGLGLAICRQLAGALGGTVTATSAPGIGSTFTLTLPADAADEICDENLRNESIPAQGPSVPHNAPEPLQCRVLLAEDFPDNQRLIGAILRRAGAEVVIAENGIEAIEMALGPCEQSLESNSDPTRPFDLILMDIQMPRLDGHAATERLRQQGYAGPIIALTAHAMGCQRQKCLDVGCDDYLSKPIDQFQLIEMVARWTRPVSIASGAIGD